MAVAWPRPRPRTLLSMETAIAIPLPGLATAIDDIRLKHTKAGAEGAPPHVTLLIPFADSESLSRRDIDTATTVLGGFEAFDVRLERLGYFDAEEAVLYLAPDPSEPLVRMIEALVQAFPAYPPYGGVHSEHIPHVTVATGERAMLELLEPKVARRLPLAARVEAARLFQRDAEGRWHPREAFPLAF
jgi:2'-5' RNA ligase